MTYTDQRIPDPEFQPEFYADIPTKRLIAWLIDSVIVVLICVALLPLTAFVGVLFFSLMLLIVGFLYRIATIGNKSSTWGMRLVAIEFRTVDGRLFDQSMAFWHTVGLSMSFAFFPLQIISIIMMLTGQRAQGLSDNFLGTVAINRRAAA